MRRFRQFFAMLILLALSACAPVAAETTPVATRVLPPSTAVPASPTASPLPVETFHSMNRVEIPAPSLAGNLVGEPDQRTIDIYLPPSYPDSDRRYPVVYYLPGYGDTTMRGVRLPQDMDSLTERGEVQAMIVVIVSGASRTGGSFYVNSPVTGNWEDHIVQDVVGYMDSHFRTLAQADSRGITGHSMGGFGALNIAMRHPDVFGAVYSMSPGLFDKNGLAESFLFDPERTIRDFVEYEQRLATLPLEEAQKRMFGAPQEFSLAYGYAFAPDPDRHPPYFDYPYSEVNGQLVRDEAVWETWESGFGGIAEETAQYRDNLLKLKGIAIDYGIGDENPWIPKGAEYYGEQLRAAGIPVDVDGYEGDHSNRLGERIRDHMLPFFSRLLVSE